MSAKLDQRLAEDRQLRDAALSLLKTDITNLRADLAGKGFGERIVDRMSEGAVDIFDEAVDLAENNRGVLATLIGAVLLWFARNPIVALFADDDEIEHESNDDQSGAEEAADDLD